MENAYKMKVLSLVDKIYPVVGRIDKLGVKKTYIRRDDTKNREYGICIGTGYTGEKCVMDGDVPC